MMAYRIEKFDDRIGYSVQELQFGDVWATIVPDVHIDTACKFAAADDMLAEVEEWHTYLFETGHYAKAEQVAVVIAKAKGEA